MSDMFKAMIRVRRRPSILDPQGKAVQQALDSLGFAGVSDVRIGKLIELTIEATSADAASAIARDACEKLLANPVMEDFDIEVESLEPAL
jgi:phosphoribosylformylglycinamidine synthase